MANLPNGKKGSPARILADDQSPACFSEAIRERLGEVKPDDPEHRTYAQVVAANLIEIACSRGAGAVTAANEISDRVEGKAHQRIEVNDITEMLRAKSDDELRFYLANGCWPEDDELHSGDAVADAVNATGKG